MSAALGSPRFSLLESLIVDDKQEAFPGNQPLGMIKLALIEFDSTPYEWSFFHEVKQGSVPEKHLIPELCCSVVFRINLDMRIRSILT